MLKSVGGAVFATSVSFFVASGATVSPLHAGDLLVRFTNEARQPIAELHVSAAGAGDWTSDLLGPDYLLPGASVLVPIADVNEGWLIDIKVVLDDGLERIRRGVDICRAEGWAATLR